MSSVTCPLGHIINVSREPIVAGRDYFEAGKIDLIVDRLVRAFETPATPPATTRNEVGFAFIDAVRALLICPTCSSLITDDEDPTLIFEPVSTDDLTITKDHRR